MKENKQKNWTIKLPTLFSEISERIKGAVIKNETEGAEGISKFVVKSYSPMEETETVFIAP